MRVRVAGILGGAIARRDVLARFARDLRIDNLPNSSIGAVLQT